MSERRITLDRLDAAEVSADGGRVSFRAVGDDGDAVVLDCAAEDVERIIRFMVGLGGNAAKRRGGVAPAAFGGTDRLVAEPIETSDIGLMRAMETGELILVARMFGFDLGFSVTQAQLAALYREIARAVPPALLAPSDHHHHHDDQDHPHHHGHEHGHGRDR